MAAESAIDVVVASCVVVVAIDVAIAVVFAALVYTVEAIADAAVVAASFLEVVDGVVVVVASGPEVFVAAAIDACKSILSN